MTKNNVDHVKAKGLMNDFVILVCQKKDKNPENFIFLND